LYWGYAQVGFRENRVKDFVNNVSNSQLTEFQALLVNGWTPKMTEIKAIRMPQYSGMSFISKVLMFLDPVAYCVLDRQIAKLRTSNSPKALNSLTFGQKETLIRISYQNENVYDRWRAECLAVSRTYFGNQYRVVDIERGFFNLVQQGYLLSAQTIYNNA
jgi:hypothetical protein